MISRTRSPFFNALIALSNKLSRFLEVFFPTMLLLNNFINKSTQGKGKVFITWEEETVFTGVI